MIGTCILLFIMGPLGMALSIYMIVIKRPILFHSYHYANMPAEARSKLAVYGGLGMFILGMGFTGLLFHSIGWPIWLKGEHATGILIALFITGLAISFLSIICCKGRAISWIWHWREDQEKNCDD